MGLLYLLINIVAIIIMNIDKKKAINGKERIPEVHLFLTAVLFGAFGVLIIFFITIIFFLRTIANVRNL